MRAASRTEIYTVSHSSETALLGTCFPAMILIPPLWRLLLFLIWTAFHDFYDYSHTCLLTHQGGQSLLIGADALHTTGNKPVLRRTHSQASQCPAGRLLFASDPLIQVGNFAARVVVWWHVNLLFHKYTYGMLIE